MRIILKIICLFAGLSCAGHAKAFSLIDTDADSIFVEKVLKQAKSLAKGENKTLFFARKLIGRPYVAHTLEVADPECLVVNTRQLDCTTLVENATALTLCASRGKCRYGDYKKMLLALRYRDGVMAGYASRLHYFSEWIEDNTRRGMVEERQSSQTPFTHVQKIRLGFMSDNPEKYDMLRRHPEMIEEIRRQEQRMEGMERRYIPKTRLYDTPALRKAVADGDIIAITTNKKGLDIVHVGIAVWKRDGLHLLNASMIYKKVVEDSRTLAEYMKGRKTFTGIRVIRIRS